MARSDENSPGIAYEALVYGRQLAADGDMEDAVEVFKMAVEAQPESCSAQLHLGCALLAIGEIAASLEPLERATRLAPRHAGSRACYGLALERAEREEAWEVLVEAGGGELDATAPISLALDFAETPTERFRELIGLVPGCCGPLLRVAQALTQRGDWEGAREAWSALLELAPGDEDAAQALAGVLGVEVDAALAA